MNKKYFTLVEIISVIIVISILAAIIIPNIADVKKEAYVTSIVSNTRNLQTTSDIYYNDKQILPSIEKVTSIQPQPIDFREIYPKYIRNLPKTPNVKYWVDFMGTVWGSQVDMPTGYQNNSGTVTWNEVPKATGYQVFELESINTIGGVLSSKFKFKNLNIRLDKNTRKYIADPNKSILISAIDEDGLLTAPVGTIEYTGYTDTLTSITTPETGVVEDSNQKPNAVISMIPEINITTETTITWDYTASTDADGDNIVAALWKVDDVVVANPPTNFTNAGEHTVSLKVQDSRGLWSDWIIKTIIVKTPNVKPTAVISYSPSVNINTGTYLYWGYSSSTDPNGDNIVSAEWQFNGTPVTSPPSNINTIGNNTISLRVKDEGGLWSDWTSITIYVGQKTLTAAECQIVNDSYSLEMVGSTQYRKFGFSISGYQPNWYYDYTIKGKVGGTYYSTTDGAGPIWISNVPTSKGTYVTIEVYENSSGAMLCTSSKDITYQR